MRTTILSKQITYSRKGPRCPQCIIKHTCKKEDGSHGTDTKFVASYRCWHEDILIGHQYEMEYEKHWVTSLIPVEEVVDIIPNDCIPAEMTSIEELGHAMNFVANVGSKYDDILPEDQADKLKYAYQLLDAVQDYFYNN